MKTELDALLAASRNRAMPDLPGAFSADVLREIRLRRADGAAHHPWWVDLLDLARRPALVAAGVGFALVVGILTPMIAGTSVAADGRQFSEFSIFSSAAPNLPSGLLARAR